MADDLDDIECVVTVLADQLGRAAARFARDQDEITDVLPKMLSAETWRDIADAIDRLRSPKTGAPGSVSTARRSTAVRASALSQAPSGAGISHEGSTYFVRRLYPDDHEE